MIVNAFRTVQLAHDYLLLSWRRAAAVHVFDGVFNATALLPLVVLHVEELLRLLSTRTTGGVDLVELVARGDVVVSLLDQGRSRRAGAEDALAADVIQGKVGQDESEGKETKSVPHTYRDRTGFDRRSQISH